LFCFFYSGHHFMKKGFLDALNEGVLLCDGAMGTMLYARGVFINRCFDELNLSSPELIKEIHREYITSGAEIIETNTFGANRFKLLPHGLENRTKEINYKGAQLARKEAGEEVYVAGAMGPIGAAKKPFAEITPSDIKSIFSEQAEALIAGGVDLIILETFSLLDELRIAIEAVREAGQLPVVAQIAFTDSGKTLSGDTPENVIKKVEEWGANVAGTNCSLGPRDMLECIKRMIPHGRNIFLSAQPNAGAPQYVEGRYIYLSSPEYMAEYARRFIQVGVRIIGGCCGTTPAHIKAISQAISASRPKKTKISFITDLQEKIIDAKPTKTEEKSSFAKKLREKFVVSVEIEPPRGFDLDRLFEGMKCLKTYGIDAVNIPDGPRATARMSPMGLAFLLESRLGVETILHFCCRDRNLLGLQSDLLAAHANGLKNLLIITGDPPKLGDYPSATAVFDVDSIGLIKLVSHLNRGVDLAGNSIGYPAAFHIGAGVNPGAINKELELKRYAQKVEAGAEYALTQPVFEARLLEDFLQQTSNQKIPLLVGILPLLSYKNAEFLHNEVPGMRIPLKIRESLKKASSADKAKELGIRIAQEALLQTRELKQVKGVYIMPPLGRYELAMKVLECLG
jgi:methionine synthase I (cobalamin-dependent)/5,10-methylenetetrahydrofolate reductase